MNVLKSTLFLLAFVTIANQLSAQSDDKAPEVKKKMVIINKTVDSDGNEVIEKIVKEGDEVQTIDWEGMEDGGDVKVIVKRIDDIEGSPDGDIKIICEPKGEKRVMIFKDGEELPAEMKEHLMKIDVDVDREGEERRIIRIRKSGEDGEERVMEWQDNGDLPEDIRQQLEAEGIVLESHVDKKIEFKVNENKAFLGVVLKHTMEVKNENGVETRSEKGKMENGVAIGEIIAGSAAEAAGLQAGDVITTIDGREIRSFDALVGALSEKAPGDKVGIAYLREGKSLQTEATLKENTGAMHKKMIFVEEEMHDDMDTDGDKKVIIIKKDGEGNEVKEVRSSKVIIIKKGDKSDATQPVIEKQEVVVQPAVENTLKLDAVSIFPNPTDGVLRVQFKGEAKPTVVSISDLSGKEVYRKDLDIFGGEFNEQISLREAAKGTLLLSIRQGEKVFSEKVILN